MPGLNVLFCSILYNELFSFLSPHVFQCAEYLPLLLCVCVAAAVLTSLAFPIKLLFYPQQYTMIRVNVEHYTGTECPALCIFVVI